MSEVIEQIYFNGIKYGTVGTLIAMIEANQLNKNFADQYVDSLEDEERMKGIKQIYEEQKERKLSYI